MTVRGNWLFALVLGTCTAGCTSSTTPNGDAGAGVSDLSTTDATADQGSGDLASADSASADLFSTASVNACPVDPMDQRYSGFAPTNPYATQPAASACINAPHDVVIVLGCPNNSDGSAATCQMARAEMAATFWNAGYANHFITSGAAVQNSYVEAVTLKQLLIDRGIPAAQIWLEQRANHTDENIYFSTRIMEANGWQNAIVISDDPGHLIMSAVCDSNCCVDLGRLTVLGFDVAGNTIKAAHYVRFPFATAISTGECTQIKLASKLMCSNLNSRLACAGNVQVGNAVDAGM